MAENHDEPLNNNEPRPSPRNSIPPIFCQSMFSIESLISQRNGSAGSDGESNSSRPPTPIPGQEASDANPSTEASPEPIREAPDDANEMPGATQPPVAEGSSTGNEVSQFRSDQDLFLDDNEAERPQYADVIPGSHQDNRTNYGDMEFLIGNWATPPRRSESVASYGSHTYDDHVLAAAAKASAFVRERSEKLRHQINGIECQRQVAPSNSNVAGSNSSEQSGSSNRAMVDAEVPQELSELPNSTTEKEVQCFADVESVGMQTLEIKLTDNETQTDKTPSFSDLRSASETANQPEFMQGCIFGMKLAAAIEKMASNGSLPRTVLTELFSIMEQKSPQQPIMPTTYPALTYQSATPNTPCAAPTQQPTTPTSLVPPASPYGIPPYNTPSEAQQQLMSNDFALALQMSQAQYNQMLQNQRYYQAMAQLPMGQSVNPYMFPNINNLLFPQQPQQQQQQPQQQRMINTLGRTPQQNLTDRNAQRAQDPQPLDDEIIDVGTFSPVPQQLPLQANDTVQREVPVAPVAPVQEEERRSILVHREGPPTPTERPTRTVHFEGSTNLSKNERSSTRNIAINETPSSPILSTRSASKKRVYQKKTPPARANDDCSDNSSGEEEVVVKRGRPEKTAQKSASSTPAVKTPKVVSKKTKQSDTPKNSGRGRGRGRSKTPNSREVHGNEGSSDSNEEEAPPRSASTSSRRKSVSKALHIDMHGQEPANEIRKKRWSRDFYKAPRK